MAKVDIGADTFDSFAGEDFADTYIAGDVLAAEAWAELDRNGRNRTLVTATRILKRLNWSDGVPSFDDTPLPVQEGTAEFAAAIAAGYDLGTEPAAQLQVRRQKAGSVEVEYFANLDSPAYQPPPLPRPVWELIKGMIGEDAGGFLPGSISGGTCGDSITENRYSNPRYYGGGPGDRDWN